MNFSSGESQTISVSRFLNWVLFPTHSVLTMLAASLPCIILYFRLRALVPPELQIEARHIAFGNAYTVIAVIALSLGSNFLVAAIIEKMVTRPLEILARWAAERHARGEGSRFHLVSLITEIRKLGSVVAQLFDEQLCRVKNCASSSARRAMTSRTTSRTSTASPSSCATIRTTTGTRRRSRRSTR